MTEEEWLTGVNCEVMLSALEGKVSDRKLRLYGCACCRRLWDRIVSRGVREAVEAAELFADGSINGEALRAVDQARDYSTDLELAVGEVVCPPCEEYVCVIQYMLNAIVDTFVDDIAELSKIDSGHLLLLREVFGNPFRPVAFNPAWRTSDVMLLARPIYEEKEFDRMPILADALQEAGCDSDDILNHLRGANATHVRGCWALDLILGKV